MTKTAVAVHEVIDHLPLLVHIQKELRNDPYCRGYKLEVTFSNQSIILTGDVRCFYHKQMANEAVRRVMKTTSTTFLFKNDIVVVVEQPAKTQGWE